MSGQTLVRAGHGREDASAPRSHPEFVPRAPDSDQRGGDHDAATAAICCRAELIIGFQGVATLERFSGGIRTCSTAVSTSASTSPVGDGQTASRRCSAIHLLNRSSQRGRPGALRSEVRAHRKRPDSTPSCRRTAASHPAASRGRADATRVVAVEPIQPSRCRHGCRRIFDVDPGIFRARTASLANPPPVAADNTGDGTAAPRRAKSPASSRGQRAAQTDLFHKRTRLRPGNRWRRHPRPRAIAAARQSLRDDPLDAASQHGPCSFTC